MASQAHVYEPVAPAVSPLLSRHNGVPRAIVRWRAEILRVPLLWKLFGANAIIVAVAASTAFVGHAGEPGLLPIMVGALLGTFAVNGGLVYLALRPLAQLEDAALQVARGELSARVPPSPLADRNVARVGRTINRLVERLTDDRAQMRELTAQVIRAEETERGRISRELHDSTAQTLAALSMQATAALRDNRDPSFESRLELIKKLTNDALEEVRTLARTIYPRVLDDLGLRAALEQLGREWANGVEIRIEAPSRALRLPREIETVLYQVARESLSNALRHGSPSGVTIALVPERHRVTLEVSDNGSGFDTSRPPSERPGIGLFSMAERVSLVEGTFSVASDPGSGTRISVTIPITGAQ